MAGTLITPEEFAAGARQLLGTKPAPETNDQVLARLAVEIRASVSTSTADAIRAGHKLLEAKALVHHGEWLPWLHKHVEMTERVAQYYMQLAQVRDTKRVSDLPLRVALKAVRAAKKARAAAAPTIALKTHTGKEFAYPAPTGPALFNTTNEHISWAGFSWNPVTGCLHGCKYCYAREIALSPTMRAHFPGGFAPVFHAERLTAPANTKVPADAATDPRLRRCFVCSMADLFGRWVPAEWILQVLQAGCASPWWVYMFLTKFPSRYLEFIDQMPPTAWLGTTVDEQKRVRFAEDAFRAIGDRCAVTYLSLEPFDEELNFNDLSMFDLVIIGAQTETRQPNGIVPARAPEFARVARIWSQAKEAGCAVWLKPNLLGITNPQSPGMILPQEEPRLTPERSRRPRMVITGGLS
jgi:protein gp37